jgi:hypothetical protein
MTEDILRLKLCFTTYILEVLQRVRLSHTTTLLTCHYTRIANELYLKKIDCGGFEGFMSFLKISVTKG